MNNPLNDRDVNGNVMAWLADQEREADRDLYHCNRCDNYVPWSDWSEKYEHCWDCHWNSGDND